MTGATRQGPLADLRVLAIEHSVAGPLSTRILADLGARVVKVERASTGGDFARHWDTNAGGESAQFWWLNRNKESIALNLSVPADRAALDRLLAYADVLVHNMSPAAAERSSLDAESLAARHPRLISCQISGYGASSPSAAHRKTYDMLIQAESGIMSLTGTSDEVCRVGVSLCDVTTGIYAALLILAAVRDREKTDEGAQIDLAMFDVALEFVAPMLMSYLNSGVEYERSSGHHHAIAPYGVFTCGDGQSVLLAIEQDREWSEFCHSVLKDPALAEDERLASNAGRLANRAQVDGAVEECLQGLDLDTFVEICDQHGFAYARVNSISEVATHPVLKERAAVEEVKAAAGTSVKSLIGLAERAFMSPGGRRRRPPAVDEDRLKIGRILNDEC